MPGTWTTAPGRPLRGYPVQFNSCCSSTHRIWRDSMSSTGRIGSAGSLVRRDGVLLVEVATICSVIPRTRMIDAPKTGSVCHSSGKASIIANTIIHSESPTKIPAMKLLTLRSVARNFFIIRSNYHDDAPHAPRSSVRWRTLSLELCASGDPCMTTTGPARWAIPAPRSSSPLRCSVEHHCSSDRNGFYATALQCPHEKGCGGANGCPRPASDRAGLRRLKRTLKDGTVWYRTDVAGM